MPQPSRPFKYGITSLEDGVYLVRVTWPDNDTPELCVAEWNGIVWLQIGIDYDIWQFGSNLPSIEIICGLDLEKIAAAEREQE